MAGQFTQIGVEAVVANINTFMGDMKKMDRAAQSTSKEMTKMGKVTDFVNKNWAALGATAGVLIGGLRGIEKAFDFGREGAVVTQTSESFGFLLEKIGANVDLLSQLQIAARGTIDDMSLMSSTATLLAGAGDTLALELANNTPQLLNIAKAANKLNPALGSTTFFYESLARGIKRTSPLILDNLGVVVKVGQANKAWAEQLGISVDELTAEERQMALLNEVLRVGGNLIDQVGGSTESAADDFDRMEAAMTNAANAIKQKLAPALSRAAEAITTLLTADQQIVAALIEQEQRTRKSAESWEEYNAEVERLVELTGRGKDAFGAFRTEQEFSLFKAVEFGRTLEETGDSWMRMNVEAQRSVPILDLNAQRMERSATVADILGGAYEGLNTNIRGTVDAVKAQIAFLAAGGGALLGQAEEIGRLFAAGLIGEEEAQGLLDQIGLAALGIQEEIGEITATEAQRTAVEEYGETWNTAADAIDEAVTDIEKIPEEIRTLLIVTVRAQFEGGGGPQEPGFQHGGQFTVGGRGGPDANLVRFRATRGEVVTVTPVGLSPPSISNSRTVNMGGVNINSGLSQEAFDKAMRVWLGA